MLETEIIHFFNLRKALAKEMSHSQVVHLIGFEPQQHAQWLQSKVLVNQSQQEAPIIYFLLKLEIRLLEHSPEN